MFNLVFWSCVMLVFAICLFGPLIHSFFKSDEKKKAKEEEWERWQTKNLEKNTAKYDDDPIAAINEAIYEGDRATGVLQADASYNHAIAIGLREVVKHLKENEANRS